MAVGEGALARYSQDGALDTTFGIRGKAVFPWFARSVAIQADGKIVVAGSMDDSAQQDFVVARYLSNGTLDSTFDGDGLAYTDFGSTTNRPTAWPSSPTDASSWQVAGATVPIRLDAGDGDDRIQVSADADMVLGSHSFISGENRLTLTKSGLSHLVKLRGIEAADLNGGISNNLLDASGFDGVTSIWGRAGNDDLRGGSGDAFIVGGPGDDVLFGGYGNDSLMGEDGNDLLNGGDGDDQLPGAERQRHSGRRLGSGYARRRSRRRSSDRWLDAGVRAIVDRHRANRSHGSLVFVITLR